MDISKKLKLIRESKGWKQFQMAEALGVSQQVYSNYENGNTKKYAPEVLTWVQENFAESLVPFDVEDPERKALQLLVRMEARVIVNASYIAEIYAKVFGVLPSKVATDMVQAVKEESLRIEEELK